MKDYEVSLPVIVQERIRLRKADQLISISDCVHF